MASQKDQQIVPLVSVILPVYGYSNFLAAAIESIQAQTLKNIELIVIEDPKNDRFENEIIVRNYQHDQRIIYLKNILREGLVGSLNKAISISRSDYVARQDADDLSLPNRLLLQYEFLAKTDYTVVGGNMIIIDVDGETKGYRKYPKLIDGKNLILSNLVAHPTVMFNKQVIISLNSYNPKMVHVEDYDLWLRLVSQGYKIHNLSEYLIKYRHHKEAIKYESFKPMLLHTVKLQLDSIRKHRNMRYNVLSPMYLFFEIICLILPRRFSYFLFEKVAIKNRY